MEYIKLKSLTDGEKAQFSHLNFCAGGNLGRSAARRRVGLRNKESDFYTYNFKARIKNLCIGLERGEFDLKEFKELASNLNLAKDTVDEMDYRIHYVGIYWEYNMLKQFMQNYIPYKYLKMIHNNRHLIKE